MSVNIEGKDKKIVKKKRGALVVFVSVFFVVGALIVLIAGKAFFADSEIISLIWLLVWLGVLPIILTLSFRSAIKGRKSRNAQHKNEK